MQIKGYLLLSAALFVAVAIAHGCRLAFGWPVSVDGVAVPMWVSWLGLAVPALLAAWAFGAARQLGRGA